MPNVTTLYWVKLSTQPIEKNPVRLYWTSVILLFFFLLFFWECYLHSSTFLLHSLVTMTDLTSGAIKVVYMNLKTVWPTRWPVTPALVSCFFCSFENVWLCSSLLCPSHVCERCGREVLKWWFWLCHNMLGSLVSVCAKLIWSGY